MENLAIKKESLAEKHKPVVIDEIELLTIKKLELPLAEKPAPLLEPNGVEPWVHERYVNYDPVYHEFIVPAKKYARLIANSRPWLVLIAIVDILLGAEIVREVGPGKRPERRHEWDKRDF